MNIWAEYVQRFTKPEAQMVLFVITQNSIEQHAGTVETAEHMNRKIQEQKAITHKMGSWEYVMAVLNATKIDSEISLKVIVPVATALPSFQLWLRDEFPNHTHEPIPRPEHGGNEHDCWITFKDDEAIKFRFMFPYVK